MPALTIADLQRMRDTLPMLGEINERQPSETHRYANDNSPHIEIRVNPDLPANALMLMASDAIKLKDIQATPDTDGLTVTATWTIDLNRISAAMIDPDRADERDDDEG